MSLMDIFKTLLMGCGALAILGMVGCVGLVGVGSYAVDQAMEEELARQNASMADGNRSTRPKTTSDPFTDYNGGQTYDEDGDQVGGWSEEAQ